MNDAYEIVGDFVRTYWKEHYICDVAILLLIDGEPREVIAFCESDSDYESVTFNTDFWEGEENVHVQDITPLYNLLDDYRKSYERAWKEHHEIL